jgi:hypothetical protein
MLLTMVVAGGNVTFYRDLEALGSVPVPRPISDCYNGQVRRTHGRWFGCAFPLSADSGLSGWQRRVKVVDAQADAAACP